MTDSYLNNIVGCPNQYLPILCKQVTNVLLSVTKKKILTIQVRG